MSFIPCACYGYNICFMYNSAFMYNYYEYRWHFYGYISAFTIGCYLCAMLLAGHISLMIWIYVDIM